MLRWNIVALDHLPREEALGILVCANPAVEYASIARARAGLELIVIEGNDGDPLATEQLHEAMHAFRGDPRVRLIRELHDHIVEELRYPFSEAQRTRRRALGGQLLNPKRASCSRPKSSAILGRRVARVFQIGVRSMQRPHIVRVAARPAAVGERSRGATLQWDERRPFALAEDLADREAEAPVPRGVAS